MQCKRTKAIATLVRLKRILELLKVVMYFVVSIVAADHGYVDGKFFILSLI